jgi:membrane protein DedA with SNARE-associated domain
MRVLHPIPIALAGALAVPPHVHHTISPEMAFFFHLGIVGIFLIAIVDSSFVPLPIPGITDILLIVYAAAHENVFLLLALAVAGSTLGGLICYTAGKVGGMTFLRKHVPATILDRVTGWVESHALLSVALPALLPPPTPMTPFVLAAGAVRMARKKFLITFAASRSLRYAFALWLGVHYGRSVLRLWSRFSARWGTTFLIALWAIVLLSTVLGIWRIWRTSRDVQASAESLSSAD